MANGASSQYDGVKPLDFVCGSWFPKGSSRPSTETKGIVLALFLLNFVTLGKLLQFSKLNVSHL